MRNGRFRGTATATEAVAYVRGRLPPGWAAEAKSVDRRPFLALRAADGRGAELPLIPRQGLMPRDVAALVASAGPRALVVSPYLGGRTRDLLAAAGVSYADATGNLRVVVNRPAIFLESVGADRDPTPTPRGLHSLRGAAAARVVRALCEFRPPYGVRTLATAARSPLGTVARVVTFLETEALLSRDARKQVVDVDWVALLARWATDYDVARTNLMRPYLEPRGLSALWPKLSRLARNATTGSAAATGLTPPRLAMIYVDDSDAAATTLELVPTEAGANVWLLEPYDDVVFERTRSIALGPEGAKTTCAAVSLPQTVVDLMTSPGRGPQEAEPLLERMKETIDDWRQPPRP